MHPENKFKDIPVADNVKYGWSTYNSILNLQMLDANENMSKQDLDLLPWVDSKIASQDRSMFFENHLIPDISLKIDDFGPFIEGRRKDLATRLKAILS